ncbi:MAG: YbjN domain-containing protein [Pseudomonadota bacterium]
MPLYAVHLRPEHTNPIEMIEQLAHSAELDAQRVDDTEVHVSLSGSWRDISLWFSWRADAQVLQIGAPLEMKVPMLRKDDVLRLLALVNERLWIGHFDLWCEDGGIIYRNGAVLSEDQAMSPSQAEILLRGAMEAFEQYYPAFNYVIWGGKNAQDALDACVLEPAGTA